MQEFSSINVSQYEAGSLADQLTEQSRDGWSVVSIVSTGSTVTAYLSREASDSVAPPVEAPAVEPTPEPAVEVTPDVMPDAATPAAEPAEDVSGWASSSSDTVPTATEPALPSSSATITPEPTSTSAPAASTPAASTPAATAGGAPAGWYADPSSRFDLRYWDGGQWTEHVSRAGQQYTDPPVA